jgi:maltose alpha-D-glucosyltransferase/alpha-amylase
VNEAHRRNLRVITELVINHTLRSASVVRGLAPRAARALEAQILCVERRPDAVFEDAHHLHGHGDLELGARSHLETVLLATASSANQPDLNFDNPHVERADHRIMRYWLDQGVDGLRLDAIPYLVGARGHEQRKTARERIRCEAHSRRDRSSTTKTACCSGEANMWPEDVRDLLRGRRRVPHGVSLPADAAHVHGHRAGGSPPDRRDHRSDARHSRKLPVGHLPAQPRRARRWRWSTSRERDYMYQMYAAGLRAPS